MRVLLLNDLPPGPTGGAEVHVGRLRDALEAAGCSVELVVAARRHEGWRRALDLWDPTARRRVRRVIAAFGPDVVHAHNILDELSTSVLGLGPPYVVTVHDPRIVGIPFGLDQERSRWAPDVALRAAKNRLGRARLRRSSEATITPSRSLAEALRAARFPSVHHLENFAPPVAPTPLGPDVLYVGALRRHKGPQVLLEAWLAVAARHPDVRLRFVGGGPLTDTIARSAAAAGLGDRVVLHGEVPPESVAPLLARAGLVAVPSLGVEGGGPTHAVIEAMAAGRPVLVTDRPGVSEGVDDAVGRIVPAGDVLAMSTALDDLLADRPGLERLGAAARLRAMQRWMPEVAAERVLAVYRSVAR